MLANTQRRMSSIWLLCRCEGICLDDIVDDEKRMKAGGLKTPHAGGTREEVGWTLWEG